MPWMSRIKSLLAVQGGEVRPAGAEAPVFRCLQRRHGNLELSDRPLPEPSLRLQQDGHYVLRGVFSRREVRELKAETLDVFEREAPDDRPNSSIEENGDMFRYQMFNRSALCQRAIGHRKILEAIEPLLGDDCHVISNTAWRNPPKQKSQGGQHWHIDAGPHVPLPFGSRWPEDLAFPIFVIATHIYLQSCDLDDGPTGVIPGSHKSGRYPPEDHHWNDLLEYEGRGCEAHVVQAGDVGMFVSDVWHRRIPPSEKSKGRLFLQTNYARRDIAQRILTTRELNCASQEAKSRATTLRQQQLIGLHPAYYYDS